MAKHRWIIALAALAWLLPASGRSQEAPPKFFSEYKIGPKDQIEVKVIKGEMFNTISRVSEDGKVTIPYVGEVIVGGLTSGELEKKLALLLVEKGLMRDPQVQVTIKELQSNGVSILGAVKEPGTIQLLGRQTLLQVISTAGGITRDAGREIIIIRRLPDGTSSALHIPVEELFLKGETKYDVPLEPGDIVNVQVDRLVQIYVMGQVKNPGALSVLQSRLPTVTQAIAQAGGFTERASEGRVRVKRRDAAGNEKEFRVDVGAILKNKAKDFQLEENDVVFVPQSLF